jgi:hypothetical protein
MSKIKFKEILEGFLTEGITHKGKKAFAFGEGDGDDVWKLWAKIIKNGKKGLTQEQNKKSNSKSMVFGITDKSIEPSLVKKWIEACHKLAKKKDYYFESGKNYVQFYEVVKGEVLDY